jgi:NTP pyrophosphatase (non-canonical NTP hydrolase)
VSEPLDLEEVAQFLRRFAAERDWDQFHTPKNLAMALAGEAGELLEIFQWLTPQESATVGKDPARLRAVEDELADVLQYVVRLADVLEIDLSEAVWWKLRENEQRYPAGEVKGSAAKRSSPQLSQ